VGLIGPAATSKGTELVAELPALRTRRSRTFLGADGRRVLRIWPGAIHFRDSRGRWSTIDRRVRRELTGNYASRVGDLKFEFSRSLSQGGVSIADADDEIRFKMIGAGAPLGRAGTA
jgi:hypothetical protein